MGKKLDWLMRGTKLLIGVCITILCVRTAITSPSIGWIIASIGSLTFTGFMVVEVIKKWKIDKESKSNESSENHAK